MEWVHMTWSGRIIGKPSEAGYPDSKEIQLTYYKEIQRTYEEVRRIA